MEGYFDDVLGLWTRNEHVGRDFELEAPEFLLAGEMLCWGACGAPFDQRKIILRFGFSELIFGVRVERCACATGGVEAQKFSGQRMRSNISAPASRQPLFPPG